MIIGFIDNTGVNVPFGQLDDTYTLERWDMPLPMLRALAVPKKPYADMTVTEIVGPPQIRLLKKRHDYYVEPASLVWAMFGNGLHRMLELATTNAIAETQIVQTFAVNLGGGERLVTLGGTPDHVADNTLTNYKSTMVYKAMKLENDINSGSEWIAAENVYAYLLRRDFVPIEHIQLCLLLKDWSARRARSEEWYPLMQVTTFPLPVWTQDQCAEYVNERLRLHCAAESLPDESLPPCTDDETWGGKRCASYCDVNKFCHQYRGRGYGNAINSSARVIE